MAFATTNQQTTVIGNLRATYGDWSGAAGDASGTVTVAGGRVWLACLCAQDSSGAYVASVTTPFSTSVSGAVTTITFYNLDSVTTGRYFIIHS